MPKNKVDFWSKRLQMNAREAINYQWEQLEKTGCIDNFRIVAGMKEGFREGYFFADSDAYKWLDAACRILALHPALELQKKVDGFISILEKAQDDDGYIYTYNQIHFTGQRWVNLQIEHELYCHGHLIEAGIAHHEATGDERLLIAVKKAADLLVREFLTAAPILTDGHEEIEIALIRLSRYTGDQRYLELARHFIQSRGRIRFFGFRLLSQFFSMFKRMTLVNRNRKKYADEHPLYSRIKLPQHNQHALPWMTPFRFLSSLFSGKYSQQRDKVGRQKRAEGHSVRFCYLQTATAMVARDDQDQKLAYSLEQVWEQMTSRRMYVTGGVGSLPLIEGFGRDYELDPKVAYTETCAALGSMLWTHEMGLLTGKPKYADLFEWQLYNAASVGIGLDGKSYFYNNPLICDHEISRAGWYDVPCCPSNLSRFWASLQKMAVFQLDASFYVNQYIPGDYDLGSFGKMKMASDLPWEGEVTLSFDFMSNGKLNLLLRLPAWSGTYSCKVNGMEVKPDECIVEQDGDESAVGLNFEDANYLHLNHEFKNGDRVKLSLSMPLKFRKQDKRIPRCGGKVALTRGPLVYCLESMDNAGDVLDVSADPASLHTRFDPDLLGGTQVIHGRTSTGEELTWIPYMLWGNRGTSQMSVFFRI